MAQTQRPDAVTPVFLLTGFLGSGKTSLIRRLMESPHLTDTALVINEFGEVGLDQLFVQSAVENTLLLENGCVCCSIRGDLVDTITDLFARAANGEIPAFSRVIVETTGLADPQPIIAALQTIRSSRPVVLGKVIVTVDGVLGAQQLGSTDEAVAQVVQADICLVTKAELSNPNAINALVGELHALNPNAAVEVLRAGSFDPDLLLAPSGPRLAAPSTYRLAPRRVRGSQVVRHRSVESWSEEIEEPIMWSRFRDWLDLLYSLRASHLLRMKAVLNLVGHRIPHAIHGVGPLVGALEPFGDWGDDTATSRIVVITKGMDAEIIRQSFRALVLPGRAQSERSADHGGVGSS
jgi:G3E family GTPase